MLQEALFYQDQELEELEKLRLQKGMLNLNSDRPEPVGPEDRPPRPPQEDQPVGGEAEEVPREAGAEAVEDGQ